MSSMFIYLPFLAISSNYFLVFLESNMCFQVSDNTGDDCWWLDDVKTPKNVVSLIRFIHI